MRRRIRPSALSQRRLLGSGWELCSTDPGLITDPAALPTAARDWISATVPSTVAGVLRSHGCWSLDSPPRRFDAVDWWYRTRFDAPESGSGKPMCLGLDGLATLADVWLNGRHILFSDNMFVSHEIPVDDLSVHDNEMVIRFASLDTALKTRRPRPRWRAPMIEHQQLRWFRTTVLGRTPGWSPPAQAVGPWRDIWIEPNSMPSLRDADLRTSLEGDEGRIRADCRIIGLPPTSNCVLVIAHQDQTHRISLVRSGAERFTADAHVANPRRWWPHTHGDPALYRAHVEISGAGAAAPANLDLGHVAFRTIRSSNLQGDFSIHVNDVPIFCRGACWTPLDPVRLHVDEDQYASALQQVCCAGMNMLRVGGTMVYESEHFYDRCDAMGIMVWQDFMFANMDYPIADANFLQSATTEVEHALARMSVHPCITVLCGNSEVEQQAAMWGASRELWNPQLFHELIAAKSQMICPGVPYWPSSAHGGAFPHTSDAGTSSYYGVGAYLRPLQDARYSQVKFASECLAFANVPEPATLAAMPGGLSVKVHHPEWKSRSPRDLGAGWDFDDVRDHYLQYLFKVEPLKLRYADHERYLALSRIASAEVMSATFCEWRRRRSSCAGALIWFFRDLWPGAGWGITASDGVAKACFYYLRRALQPRSIFMSDEGGNGLTVHVVNERGAPWDAQLSLSLYRQGEHLVGRSVRAVKVAAREAIELPATDWFDEFRDLSHAYRFGPAAADLIVATILPGEHGGAVMACHFPLGLPSVQCPDIGLSADASSQSDGSYRLTIQSRAFAYAVCADADGYDCDDRYFHLAPGQAHSVFLRPIAARSRALHGVVRAANCATSATIKVQS